MKGCDAKISDYNSFIKLLSKSQDQPQTTEDMGQTGPWASRGQEGSCHRAGSQAPHGREAVRGRGTGLRRACAHSLYVRYLMCTL